MGQSNFPKSIVTNAVRMGLRNIRNDSSRGVRYMVDLGAHLAKSPEPKRFFTVIQNIFGNPKSVYYKLVSDIVRSTDAQTLETVGINVGYMSWTCGARTIRRIESSHGHSIPWTLLLDWNGKPKNHADLNSIVSQGRSLGIHTYMVFSGKDTGNTLELLDCFDAFPDCAFVLFSDSEAVTAECAGKMLKNVMVLVSYDHPKRDETMKQLAEQQRMFGAYYVYNNDNAEEILSGRLLTQFRDMGYTMAFFVADAQCSLLTAQSVSQYIESNRNAQSYPIFLCELLSDIDYVDQVVSGKSCAVQIGCDGTIRTADGVLYDVNMRTHTLEQALALAFPRTAPGDRQLHSPNRLHLSGY